MVSKKLHLSRVGLAVAVLSAIALNAHAEERRIAGSGARAFHATQASCFSTYLARMTNTCTVNRTLTIAPPLEGGNVDKSYKPSLVFLGTGTGSRGRAVGVAADNGWMWTQGWVSFDNGQGLRFLGDTFVPKYGTLIIDAELAPNHSVTQFWYWSV